MNDWHELCPVNTIKDNTLTGFEIAGKKIMLAMAQGEYFALDDMCTHDDISLSLGCLVGKTVRCSLHGAVFDLKTGKVLAEPAEENLATFQLKINEDKIQILV